MYKFEFIKPGVGQIRIDDFSENFISDHSYWTQEMYESHWKEADKMVKEGMPTCFITSITDPKNTNFIRIWECFPVDGKIAFHESFLFLDELVTTFVPSTPWLHMEHYEFDEEVSEWRTKI